MRRKENHCFSLFNREREQKLKQFKEERSAKVIQRGWREHHQRERSKGSVAEKKFDEVMIDTIENCPQHDEFFFLALSKDKSTTVYQHISRCTKIFYVFCSIDSSFRCLGRFTNDSSITSRFFQSKSFGKDFNNGKTVLKSNKCF